MNSIQWIMLEYYFPLRVFLHYEYFFITSISSLTGKKRNFYNIRIPVTLWTEMLAMPPDYNWVSELGKWFYFFIVPDSWHSDSDGSFYFQTFLFVALFFELNVLNITVFKFVLVLKQDISEVFFADKSERKLIQLTWPLWILTRLYPSTGRMEWSLSALSCESQVSPRQLCRISFLVKFLN